MADRHRCIAVFVTREQTAEAISTLISGGFDPRHLSVMGRDVWEVSEEIGVRQVGDKVVYGGAHEKWWMGIWSVLPQRSAQWFFDDGPLLVAGAIVSDFALSDEGIGELETAISLLGIPRGSAAPYASELTNGRFLVIAQGSMEEAERAEQMLRATSATNHTLHHGE